MGKKLPSLTAVYVVVAASFLLLPSVVTRAELIHLGRENGVFENIGTFLFLVASANFLLTFIRSYGQKHAFLGISTRGNVYFGMLALLMFVCFGEEISWGQSIWSWETPTWLASQNAQGETNLHNLWLFHGTNPDGSKKSWIALMLNMGRLLALFSLLYCILVPLAAKLSGRIRDLLAWTGVPIPSLAIGGLFIVVYVAFHASIHIHDLDLALVSSLDELKEAGYALTYALLSGYFLLAWQPKGS